MNIMLLTLILFVTSCAPSQKFSGGNQGARKTPKKTLDQVPDTSSETTVQPPAPQPPANAIVKGSFSVWATPSRPAQGEDYIIHIQIKLPSQTMNYYRNDLSGTLIGTDGYSQTINHPKYFMMQRFTYVTGSPSAEFAMLIPGAASGVNDTIKVTSKLLNESQDISVRFN